MKGNAARRDSQRGTPRHPKKQAAFLRLRQHRTRKGREACNYIRAVFAEQIGQWQITFLVSLCIKFKQSFTHRFPSLEHRFEMRNTILLGDAYLGEELCQIFCIIDYRVAGAFSSRDILYQDVLFY